jgi:hypothetical protein
MAGGGPTVVKLGGSQAFSQQLTERAGKIQWRAARRSERRTVSSKHVPGVGRP